MTPSPSRPAWAACSRARLRHNLGLLSKAVGGPGRILAVVKADAYGHGAAEAGRALQAAGVGRFGVATLEEGVALREAGIRGMILLLGSLEARYARDAHRHGIALTAWSRTWLDECARALGPGRSLDIHLKVDTGMARLGFFAPEVPGLLADFDAARWRGLALAGAYTHLACADERPDRVSAAQLDVFDSLPWPKGLPLHAANSAAALRYPRARYAFVRSGLLLYGAMDPSLSPSARQQAPLLKAYATVLRVAALKAGTGIGYGHTASARKAMRVATVCAGYADGVPRLLSNRGKVLIQGRACAVLGRVSMDSFMADVTGLTRARPGDTVTLLDGLDGPCSARGWAKLCGTNAYELLCGLSARLPRRWED
ncbi:MAG TPA: alanine racemase [bacterium]|jgi:alanine racemase|nr:alanine racemase [bacterium]